MAFKGKNKKGGFKRFGDAMMKSVHIEEKDDGQRVRLYFSPEEANLLAEKLTGDFANSVRVDVHIKEREGNNGSFLSGFIFAEETDGQRGGKGKYPTKFKKKGAPPAKKSPAKKSKKRFEDAEGEEE